MPATPTNGFDLIYSFISSEKFIAALIGAISGTVATFVAPWTKWHFKEKELKRHERKERIEKWRSWLNGIDSLPNLYHSPFFDELVDEIPEQEKNDLFANVAIELNLVNGATLCTGHVQRIVARLHKVISQKEKAWGLI